MSGFTKWVMLGALLLAGAVFAKTEVTVYCDEGYSPYSYSEGNQARGVYVDVLQKAFARMPDYNVKIVPSAWKRGMMYVENGEGFAIFPPYYREERTKFGIHSEPILSENVVAVSKPGLAKTVKKWPDDVYGKKVGINSGFSTGGDAFFAAGKAGKITIEEAKTNQMNVGKLNLDRIDFYVNDKIAILWEIKKMKLQNELTKDASFEVACSISKEDGYLLFSKKGNYPYRDDFIKKFNAVIVDMKAKGEIQKVIEDYVK